METFIDEFRAWESKLPNSSQQESIEDLRQKVEAIETKSRQEKHELEQSLQSQISKLEQELAKARSQNNQIEDIKVISIPTQIQELENKSGLELLEQPQKEEEIINVQEKLIRRRRLLQWAGFGSSSLGIAIVAREIFKKQQIPKELTQVTFETNKSSTSQPSPKPKTASIAEAKLDTIEFKTVTVDQEGKIVQRSEKQAKCFKEDLGNGVNLEMGYIPGGKFMMGTEDEEIEKLIKKYNSEWNRKEKTTT